MDGSQLPTEWTHLNEELVGGVSDSKKRELPLQHSATASKKGPMSQEKEDVTKMSKISKSSMTYKNLNMAEKSESGTNL